MKQNKSIIIIALVAMALGYGISVAEKSSIDSYQLFFDVESIAACESVGWWDNNGNCVKNDQNQYFCKTDSWAELTDCVQ